MIAANLTNLREEDVLEGGNKELREDVRRHGERWRRGQSSLSRLTESSSRASLIRIWRKNHLHFSANLIFFIKII